MPRWGADNAEEEVRASLGWTRRSLIPLGTGSRGRGQVDARVLELRRAGVDALERDEAIGMQACCVDGFAGGQVGGEFAQSLAELAAGAQRIAALVVMEGDGTVNEGLQEEAARTALRGPCRFPDFVARKKPAAVEEVDAAAEQLVHEAKIAGAIGGR